VTDSRKTQAELIEECEALRDRITEIEARQHALAEDVLDSSAAGIFVLDEEFRVAWINKPLEHFFGLERDGILGKDKRQLIRERIRLLFENPEGFSRKVLATYDDNTYIESFECHVLPDGDRKERWLEHRSQPIRSGLYAGGRIEHYYDITDRKQAEQALQQSEARYQAMMERMYDVIAELDAEGRCVYVSPSCEKVLGYAPEELLGRAFFEVLRPDHLEPITTLFERALASDKQQLGRALQVRHKDGSWRSVESTAFTFKTASGEKRLLAIARDTTERKTMEDQLRRSERLASIGTLAAGIAHEINNPLGGTLLAAQFALEFKEDSTAVVNALKAIIRQTKRCGEIVTSVLTFAQERTSEKRKTELNEVVQHARDLIRTFAEQKGASIELALADGLPPVVINETELGLVIVNLIRNAAEAGAKHIVLRTEPSPDCVRVVVQDDGTGITKEQMAHIFEPFYTTREKQGGTGLGLSIAHGIVRGHGGTIDVESELEEGTTITISLPRTGGGDG
jgi:PAS domain S-box-containing protein